MINVFVGSILKRVIHRIRYEITNEIHIKTNTVISQWLPFTK